MKDIRILLADDHNVLRQGIAQLLDLQPDMQVVAEASDGREAVQLARTHQPTVALIDINMPEMDGVEVTRILGKEFPELGMIILTMYKRQDFIFEAIKAGASGYLLKEVEIDELLAAVRSVASGEAVIDPALANRVLDEFRPDEKGPTPISVHKLAKRDIEILSLLSKGHSNQEIADRLDISEKTVRNRLSLVFKQLHLKNRTEAALYALREGITEGDPPPNNLVFTSNNL